MLTKEIRGIIMGTASSSRQRPYSAKERAALVEGYQSGGLSQKRWCEENGVSLSTLRKWLQREKQEPDARPEQTWAPVSVEEQKQEDFLHVRSGKFSIAVGKGADMELLSAVLRVVAALC